MIFAIESGTTRTRVWAISAAREPVEAASGLAGARDLAGDRDRSWLLAQIKDLVDEAAASVGAEWGDIEAVVGFGMISSELGLVEVPPLVAPVTGPQLANSMVKVHEAPFPASLLLVPGVLSEADRIEDTDIMRGEETEIVGLLALDRVARPFLYVSPGSHSKFVWVDQAGRIVWGLTTLSGELMWALHRETILADLIDLSATTLDPARVEEGASIAEASGLTHALFAARVANRWFGASSSECSALLHGAVAHVDLHMVEDALPTGAGPVSVALSGRGVLQESYRHLLRSRVWVREVDVIDQPIGALGASFLYEAAVAAARE